MDKKIYIPILFLIIVCLVFLLSQKSICGNKICEKDENCGNCEDCKCKEGQYCSNTKCVTPVCGNGECELFEKPSECCIDCECWNPGEVCNIEINKCEVREIRISDDRIRELVISYFEGESKEVISLDIKGLITWENKLGKNVIVEIKGQEWFSTVIVTEDEKVIDTTI